MGLEIQGNLLMKFKVSFIYNKFNFVFLYLEFSFSKHDQNIEKKEITELRIYN